ncbi:putative recQ-mediated genome instability protein [Medicago truncatula]|uniref:Putative recQ-mediated genome instability protein n=1 Tax=Medicago truncatula TaxID=3880 RepID=A0A072UJT6_MEDTR|nr:recQ-mediated genome instability protein 2 [Medicago truncatula]KEH29927.1 recQ-mediated genome instability-like protein [Medicago truncatula]RHN60599.1 putative recQ-mediated genome instability protein [Medicago truncatula]
MDYSLAALKLFCSQLKLAREVPSQHSFTLGGILFQRAWLQGVLVSSNDGSGPLLLDDGTGIIELSLSGEFRQRQFKAGMYVMVVGGYATRATGEPSVIKVHKIVDLSSSPDREAMWYLEVMEAYKLFYQPLVENFI